MKTYKVEVVPEAEEKLREYLSYLLFIKRSRQAYDAVREDYTRTLKKLRNLAGSIREPDEPELVKRGLKKILFDKHDYFLLYEIENGEKPVARVIDMFHSLEDFVRKLK